MREDRYWRQGQVKGEAEKYCFIFETLARLRFCNNVTCCFKNETHAELPLLSLNQPVFDHLTPHGCTANTKESGGASHMAITGVPGLEDSLHLGIHAVFLQCRVLINERRGPLLTLCIFLETRISFRCAQFGEGNGWSYV